MSFRSDRVVVFCCKWCAGSFPLQVDIGFSEGDKELERERAEREGRRTLGIYSVTFTLITGSVNYF